MEKLEFKMSRGKFESFSSAGNFNGRAHIQGQRPLPDLSKRRYDHNLRVRCAAGRDEDGGTRERRRSKDSDAKDHYRVLGLRRQATAPAIKSAFRQLARQYHPDVNKDVDANDKFKSIRLAYEVLSDEASRRLYDSTLQEQAKSSRRNQVYQRRDQDTRPRSSYNRPRYRRASYDTMEWDYSPFSFETEYANPGAYYPSSGPAAFRWKRTNSVENGKAGKARGGESRPRDWETEWRSMGKEAVLFLWVVSALWHALGAQTALGLLVGTLALWRDFAVGYRVASGVAWLMGGEKGLAVAVALIATTRVFGKAYHAVAAILVLALWLGGSWLKAVPLPPGAILVMVYKCIQLQSSSS